MENRLVLVAQVTFVILSCAALYWLMSSGRMGIGISTDKAVAIIRGKDLEYERSVQHANGASEIRSKGHGLKYSFNAQEYQRGLEAIDRSDFAGAQSAFQAILAETPDETSAMLALGTSLYLQRRNKESEAIFRKLLEHEPQFSNARAGLAAVLSVECRYPEAIEQYSLAIGEDPTFALSYFGRGVAYYHVGKRVEAEAELRKTVDLLPATAQLAALARQQLTVLAKQSADARN